MMDDKRLQKLAGLEERLGWKFSDKRLLDRALTHRSFANENPSLTWGDNETLEFLGDAVLQLIISDVLMRIFPDYAEGRLSKLRSSVVNEQPLAELSRSFSVGEYLLLGKGEEASGGRTKTSLLANSLESIIAAIFLDGGFDRSSSFITSIFEPLIRQADADASCQDYKTSLQELSMLLFKAMPHYNLLSESGPDHDKRFEMGLSIGERFIARGTGKNKKDAEKMAAKTALEALQENLTEKNG
jgi:ribonuclease III